MNFSNEKESNYEFTQSQNDQITKLARMMRIVGIVFLVSGVLSAIVAFSPLSIVGLLESIALGVIGYSLVNAAASFKKIVDTEGNDINNLMNALTQLYTACAIQLWSVVAVIVLAILTVLFMNGI